MSRKLATNLLRALLGTLRSRAALLAETSLAESSFIDA